MKFLIFAILSFVTASFASDRFPRPEFQTGYEIPPNDFGAAREIIFYYMDVAILFAALCLASYFVLKKRSRKGIVGLALFSIAYFGFYKKGCVCSLGAIQNITAGLSSSYTISITIFLIFILPLIFSLFFGRVFCSGVCPLGAVQDLVAFKAKRVPARLSAILGFIPHIYLGLTILFAATGAGFLICKFDPFVGIFRLGAPFGIVAWGVGILILGIFVARPYCRYLCPYGLILGWASAISKYRVKVCPDTCVNCRLCENVCPVDAILPPTVEPINERRSHAVKRLKIYFVMLPVWIAVFATSGWFSADLISTFHPDVKLLRIIELEESGTARTKSFESEALRVDADVIAVLRTNSERAKKDFKLGMLILGAYLGLILGAYLIRQSTHKKREYYDADPVTCVSCGKCYGYCPKNEMRNAECGMRNAELTPKPSSIRSLFWLLTFIPHSEFRIPN
ncbi:MAG: 4Fe-4S binding protein [Chitinispirillales bacterium]|jgi:polyferredoxin|nr:4Fe-4S binding protein [Chitinispirillales bacterium]